MWSGDRSGADLVKQGEGLTQPRWCLTQSRRAEIPNADDYLRYRGRGFYNKKNLMDELSKIGRIIDRPPEAEKEIFLVLDAATGQNAVNCGSGIWVKFLRHTGIVLTSWTALPGAAWSSPS